MVACFRCPSSKNATRRALANGALQPIETQTILLDSDGVRFVVRTVSSLAHKDKARHAAAATIRWATRPCPVRRRPRAFAYVLLNKFPLLAGHVLLVTRRFERQQRLLAADDFAALSTCLGEVDGLGFYNGGVEAGASQLRKHLQLVPLPLAADGLNEVPMERVLGAGSRLTFRHAFSRLPPQLTAAVLHAVYRELLDRCGISAVATAEGEVQSAPYNLLVRRSWMLVVPRSRACFESIAVNGLGFAGSLFVRSQHDLDRVREVGPMQVLRAVATPQDAAATRNDLSPARSCTHGTLLILREVDSLRTESAGGGVARAPRTASPPQSSGWKTLHQSITPTLVEVCVLVRHPNSSIVIR